jgi:hypothetical protein
MSEYFPPIPQHSALVRLADEKGGGDRPKEDWENEGGHTSATRGRVISTPAGAQRYKVVLSDHCGAESERGFASMRAAEAFIRRNTPRPIARSTLWDRDAPNP